MENPSIGEWQGIPALRELGHAARLDEIDARAIERESFSVEQEATRDIEDIEVVSSFFDELD